VRAFVEVGRVAFAAAMHGRGLLLNELHRETVLVNHQMWCMVAEHPFRSRRRTQALPEVQEELGWEANVKHVYVGERVEGLGIPCVAMHENAVVAASFGAVRLNVVHVVLKVV